MTRTRKTGRLLLGVLLALVVASTAGTASAADPPTARAAVSSVARTLVAPGTAVSASSAASWTAGGLIATSAPRTQAVSSSSGFVSVGGCTFYATSASAGAYCSSGVPGDVVTLAEYLHGRPFVPCRYFPLPEGMYLNAPVQPGGEWRLKACFQNVDMQRSWGGRSVEVEIFQQFVRDGEEPELPDYMDAFWNFQADRNYYPIPRISFGPSNPARVGAYTYFWTTWVEALDNGKEAEPDYRIRYNTGEGLMYLHATIHDVVIHPGLVEMGPIDCGKADVVFDVDASDAIPDSEGGSQPSECWTQYTHSTASRDDDTVQVRATAYWRVTVERPDGSVRASLGDFHYETNQRLAVAEIQTLTDW